MSADEQQPTAQPSSQQIQRRSFLKMVLAGLAAAIPVAAGLLKPNVVYAGNCTALRCEPGHYYVCVNHTQYLCVNGELCYDYFTGDPLCQNG
jgi:hypothetical protein